MRESRINSPFPSAPERVHGDDFHHDEDFQATFNELKGRGVEFVDQPQETPYGLDSSFRDPSGNHIRLT